MKRFSIVIVLILLFIFVVNTVCASESELYKWTYEDFEDVNGNLGNPTGAGYIQWTENGAGGSKGAAKLTMPGTFSAINFDTYLQKDKTYKLSAWIKTIDTVPITKSLTFVFYSKPANGSSTNAYNMVTVTNVNYVANEWVYVETEYTHDGQGNGQGNDSGKRIDLKEGMGNDIVSLRVGSPNAVYSGVTNSGSFACYIDDVVIEPVFKEFNEEDIVSEFLNGDFEEGFLEEQWKYSNCIITETDGANGTNIAVELVSDGNGDPTIKQKVPVLFNRPYKISFYAKASSDEAVGEILNVKLDRNNGKTDSNIFQDEISFPQDALNSNFEEFILSEQWEYYEFIFKEDLVTFEGNWPYLIFYINNTSSDISYCLDEIIIEDTENLIYNGDISENVENGWKLRNVTTEVSDELPEELALSSYNGKSVRITERGNSPSLYQGIAIENGETYRISFWAKGESWNGSSTELALEVLLDRTANGAGADEILTEYLPSDKSFVLTKDWNYYEFEYTCSHDSSIYRQPMMSWRLGYTGTRRAIYLVTDVKVEKLSDNGTDVFRMPIIKSISLNGKVVESNSLSVEFRYDGTFENVGNIIRVYKTNGTSKVRIASAEILGNEFDYLITSNDVGYELIFEIIPIDSEGNIGSVRNIISNTVKYLYTINRTSSISADNLSYNVDITNNSPKKDFLIMLCLFDSNNKMLAIEEDFITIECEKSSTLNISIPFVDETKFSRIFVWEGVSSKESEMISIIGQEQLEW